MKENEIKSIEKKKKKKTKSWFSKENVAYLEITEEETK